MKKLLVAAALVAFAHTASAEVANTKHDLSPTGPGTTGTKSSCMYCHNAHKTSATVTVAPLWNRNMSTLSFTQDGAGVTGERSLTCLSCHDGTTDLGSTLINSEVLGAIGAAGIIGDGSGATRTLDREHPVSVAWVVDGDAKVRSQGDAATALSITDTTKLDTIECSGCHDPHESVNTKFLRDAIGEICVACHAK